VAELAAAKKQIDAQKDAAKNAENDMRLMYKVCVSESVRARACAYGQMHPSCVQSLLCIRAHTLACECAWCVCTSWGTGMQQLTRGV